MSIAVVGSRDLFPSEAQLAPYLSGVEEIVSGGVKGAGHCMAHYAKKHNINLPEYKRYGRAAPIIRNRQIVDYANKVVVFWSGNSKGTRSAIQYAQKGKKGCEIMIIKEP